ncbi:MAG TPA: DUF4055 domain-containing protein [Blastocatellia bacterium]|nr:DUF4055 domain-containing protein [Blastocatellia bacterium]
MHDTISTRANTPDCECGSYRTQMADVELFRDVMCGTRRLRQRAVQYLPQHPAEEDAAYTIRLNQTVLFNATRRTVKGLTGMVFRKPPVLGQDVPAEIRGDSENNIEGHWENIDLEGTHGDVFAQELFVKGFDGHAFILVDMQRAVTADNPEATRKDELDAGLRPYWVLIEKAQVLNWRTELVKGARVLSQVTIKECRIEAEGQFGEVQVDQYRVLRPGEWEIWRWVTRIDTDGTITGEKGREYRALEIHERGTTPLDFIPLVVYYANRTGYLESTPPLLDLAYENIEHYQLRSDLRHTLHIANVPILVRKGGNPNEDLAIGPNTIVDIDTDGDLKYTEHQGHAIGKSQEEIATTEQRMAALGLMLLMNKPAVQQTATETVIDAEAESSELAGMARNLEDALEQALQIHARWLKKESGGSIQINRKFTKMQITSDKIRAWLEAIAVGALPRELFWEMLMEAEEIPPGRTIDDMRNLIESDDIGGRLDGAATSD